MNNLKFTIQTAYQTKVGKLKSIMPNKDGVIEKFPVAVIGGSERSENGISYEPNSFIQLMTDPNNIFNKRLTRAGLMGERDHPDYSGMDKNEMIKRTMTLVKKLQSHTFIKFESSPVPGSSAYVIYAWFKCKGPYGDYLKEDLADPNLDACMSLRSLTDDIPGSHMRRAVALSTFDSVDCGGIEGAAGRGAISQEALVESQLDNIFNIVTTPEGVIQQKLIQSLNVSKDELMTAAMQLDQIGEECINLNDDALFDTLGSDDIQIVKKDVIVGVSRGDSKIVTPDNNIVTPFHALF